jgi:prolyl oligopeptidase
MTLKSATLSLTCLLTLTVSTSLAQKQADIAVSKIKRITNHLKRKSSLPTPQYPTANRDATTNNYHGTTVADPYRWLEDTDAENTKQWVTDENKVTFDYLEQIPTRQPLIERLTELWNYERFGRPLHRGDNYFFSHNNGLQNQSILYVTTSLEVEPQVLIDSNQWSSEGTEALASWVPSPDGKQLAYAVASAGSDWREWFVLDVATGKKHSDHIQWSKFSGVSWAKDNSGFYYSAYDKPAEGAEFTGTNYHQKLFFHKLGEAQDQDKLIYERSDEKEWGFGGYVTEDGNYLIISVWKGTLRKNQVFYLDLKTGNNNIVELISGFDADYSFVGNDESTFWFITDLDAPRKRLIKIDVANPDRQHWSNVISQTKHTLESASNVGQRFIVQYLEHAQNRVYVYSETGEKQREIELPGVGSTGGFGGQRSDVDTFYTFTNFVTPATIYHYDIAAAKSTIYRQPKVDFNPSDYETKQHFVTSNDGTQVPVFVTSKCNLKRDGSNPTILYGYGGFDISLTPGFSVSNLVWMEMGGVYVVANLRGGGEYGSDWHEAGMLDNKQNVFDDFISCSQWLIDQKITSTPNLAIRGGSNGGLLVGACMTQRPELFGAALPAVGVMDMLRYHKFTIGWAWVSEYGSSADKQQFQNLIKYSPLHNLTEQTHYPATMITTADHDDRVVPGHSFKFAAQLQHAHRGQEPVLIRIESSAGHGAGTPTTKRIQAAADMWAFLTQVLKHKNWKLDSSK